METRTIILEGQNIEYIVRTHPRAKRLRATVYPGGKLVVTLPKRYTERPIGKFLIEKSTWILKALNKSKSRTSLLPKADKASYKRYKETSRSFVHERIEHFNQIYNLKFNNVRIGNQTSLWGSCSIKRNLNFNYRIIFLPPKVADYLIVHELCHLKEFNHGPNFWAQVERAIPNYKLVRRQLNKYNLSHY